MKTIEIQSKEIVKNKKLIRRIAPILKGVYFHYFFEPELIIRLRDKKTIDKVKEYLLKRKIKFIVYNYPFPSGKHYGEVPKSIGIKYRDFFEEHHYIDCKLALIRKKKEDYEIFLRYTHCLMNQFGYEWQDEVKFHLQSAHGRVSVIEKYDAPSLSVKLFCKITKFFIHISYKLSKLL